MTVTEVKGYGRQKGHTEIYRGAEYVVNFLPKLRIEVAVDRRPRRQGDRGDHPRARTGQIGDGKIFVTPIDHALRIRTGETDSRRAVSCQPFLTNASRFWREFSLIKPGGSMISLSRRAARAATATRLGGSAASPARPTPMTRTASTPPTPPG